MQCLCLLCRQEHWARRPCLKGFKGLLLRQPGIPMIHPRRPNQSKSSTHLHMHMHRTSVCPLSFCPAVCNTHPVLSFSLARALPLPSPFVPTPRPPHKMKFTSLFVLAGLPAGSAFVAPAKAFHGAGVATSGATRSASSSSSSCQMMARVPFIAGNWKMNPIDLDTAKDLAKAVS